METTLTIISRRQQRQQKPPFATQPRGSEAAGGPARASAELASGESASADSGSPVVRIRRINAQPQETVKPGYNSGRYRLHFQQETREEVEMRRKAAQQPLVTLPPVSRLQLQCCAGGGVLSRCAAPLGRCAAALVRQRCVSEDGRFCDGG